MNPTIREYMRQIGAKGGKVGKRQLSSDEAKRMAAASAKVRANKRATGSQGAQKGVK